jgi:hypothetical protein
MMACVPPRVPNRAERPPRAARNRAGGSALADALRRAGIAEKRTPAGIFSVIQKEAEHYLNLYDDAYMPHMQRITWSGIALHGGPLPGYPASHGCVRMPYDFAEHLFDITKLGMRVIIAPSDVAPAEIAHPALFTRKSDIGVVAAAQAAEAKEAASKADHARLAAVMASREASRAATLVRSAENLMRRAEAQIETADRAVASARSDEAKEQAENAKAKLTARAAEIEVQLAAAKTELQSKLDAVAAAREAAVTAETAKTAAAKEAHKLARALEPLSVFISRKTQRLYVRQAFQPILEGPVMIQDADHPIGTHVFTAMERNDSEGDMRWSVVSMPSRHADAGVEQSGNARGYRDRDVEPTSTDQSGAIAALNRNIAEMNLFVLLSALGLSHTINGERLLPIGTLYDPFIARGFDALNYACYQDARFIVVATPSGVTLAPEGGAHQSIAEPLIGLAQDGLASFEPAFVETISWRSARVICRVICSIGRVESRR